MHRLQHQDKNASEHRGKQPTNDDEDADVGGYRTARLEYSADGALKMMETIEYQPISVALPMGATWREAFLERPRSTVSPDLEIRRRRLHWPFSKA